MNRNRRRMEILAGLGIIILLGLLLSAGNTVFAEEEGGVLYSNDFEKEDDISNTPGTNVTEYKINFKGLSEEQAHSGKKSCKIDVTVNDGHYIAWHGKFRIPLTEDITFSGYLFPNEVKACRFSFKIGILYPKAIKTKEEKYKIKTPFFYIPAVTGISPGRWCQFFADSNSIYKQAKNLALRKGWDYTDMFIYRWLVIMEGGQVNCWKGKERRIVVYVDDVSINREEPEEEIY